MARRCHWLRLLRLCCRCAADVTGRGLRREQLRVPGTIGDRKQRSPVEFPLRQHLPLRGSFTVRFHLAERDPHWPVAFAAVQDQHVVKTHPCPFGVWVSIPPYRRQIMCWGDVAATPG